MVSISLFLKSRGSYWSEYATEKLSEQDERADLLSSQSEVVCSLKKKAIVRRVDQSTPLTAEVEGRRATDSMQDRSRKAVLRTSMLDSAVEGAEQRRSSVEKPLLSAVSSRRSAWAYSPTSPAVSSVAIPTIGSMQRLKADLQVLPLPPQRPLAMRYRAVIPDPPILPKKAGEVLYCGGAGFV
eukprot:m.248872 g.248872  ORF g.248872 m.248872 type:complete len:183 (+) comp40296_c1_seq27:620-1168(+)